jgi:hypothetical protein
MFPADELRTAVAERRLLLPSGSKQGDRCHAALAAATKAGVSACGRFVPNALQEATLA